MKRHRLLFTGGSLSPTDAEFLARAGFDVDVQRVDLDEAELAASLVDKDAYILGGVERASANSLAQADRLKVIAFLGVGYHAFVDTPAATARGIAVTNAPGANARAVAEFTVALMLDAWRRVTYLVQETKQGRWPELQGRNLEGRTLGVIGMGAIGSIVATIAAQGFGMRVVYHSRSPHHELDTTIGATRLALDDLLEQADVVSLHIPYGPETDRLLDGDRLARVKPGLVLVNTSEAEVVDPGALRAALLDGRIAAVAMDGYYLEPVPTAASDPYGLLALPDDRLIITPHTANATEESFQAMLSANVAAIRAILETGMDSRVVNPGFRENAGWLAVAGLP